MSPQFSLALGCHDCNNMISIAYAGTTYYSYDNDWYEHFLLHCTYCGRPNRFFLCRLPRRLVEMLIEIADSANSDETPIDVVREFALHFGFYPFAGVVSSAGERRRIIRWLASIEREL